jgi:cytochrome c biogenesis protein CcmG, thiol:disulfide interchange protein DsbE
VPRPWRSVALGLAVAVVVVAVLVVALNLTSTSATSTTAAPSFSVPRLGGGPPVSLPVVGVGAHAPVVLTFFASWCSSCHSELPVVAAVAHHESAARAPVVFLGIDDNDAAASGLAFARRSDVTFPVGKDFYTEVGAKYRLEGLPDTVFIDAAGHIVATVHGPVTKATLQRWLTVLLRSRSGALAA